MSITITSTKDAVREQGLKFLIFGQAGAGKTYLASTTGELDGTLIVSAEGGMVTLHKHDIDKTEVRSMADLTAVHNYLASGKHDYRWIVIDSISEIAEVVLEYEMGRTNDGRRAYGEMATRVLSLMRKFRNLPQHVVMTAKLDRYEDSGAHVYRSRLPGNMLKDDAPHIFDEVFALRVATDKEGKTKRFLQTGSDGQWEVKDRSGALDKYEEPDLAAIVAKIQRESGVTPKTQAAPQERAAEPEPSGEEVAPGVHRHAKDGEMRTTEHELRGEPEPAEKPPSQRTRADDPENWDRFNARWRALVAEAVSDDVARAYHEATKARLGVESFKDVTLLELSEDGKALKALDHRPGDDGEASPRALHIMDTIDIWTTDTAADADKGAA